MAQQHLVGPGPLHCRGFTITLSHTTLGRTPLDEWSARLRDLYLTTHSTQKRETSMPRRDSNPQSQQASGHSSVGHSQRYSQCGTDCEFISGKHVAQVLRTAVRFPSASYPVHRVTFSALIVNHLSHVLGGTLLAFMGALTLRF